jgi:hypothetical protein
MFPAKKLSRTRNLLLVLFFASIVAFLATDIAAVMISAGVSIIASICLATAADSRMKRIREEDKRHTQMCLVRIKVFPNGPPDMRDVVILPESMIEVEVD